MKRLLAFLVVLLAATTAVGQRSRGVQNPVNLLPLCTATSGSCPAQDYFCRDSSDYIVYCTNSTWTWVKSKEPVMSTDCSAITQEGRFCWDTDNDILYMGDGTTAIVAGGGGGAGITVQELDVTVGTQITTLDFRAGLDVTHTPAGEANVTVDLTETTPAFSAPVVSNAQILVYDGVDSFDNKTLDGDVRITNQGVATIQPDSVALTTDTTGDYVSGVTASQGLLKTGTEGATLGFIDCAANEIMKRNAGDTAWECGSDTAGSGGSPVVLDLGDDSGNDSVDLTEIATTGDTNNIFTESAADKLLIAVGNNWPTADLATTATALAANGANCSAGNFPLGVDASGAVESCTDAATQAELNAWTGSTNVTTLGTIGTGVWNGTVVDEAYLDTNTVLDNTGNTFTTGLQVIDGNTNVIQLRIQGNATQSADTFVVEKSDGTDVFVVNESTGATFGGTSSSITAAAGQNLNVIAATSQSVRIGDGGSNYAQVSRAGVMTFAGTAEFNLPTSATPTPTVEGRCWWDTDDLLVCGTGSTQAWQAKGNSAGEATALATNALAQATDISTGLCTSGQILKNNAGTWECAADSTGGTPDFGSITNGTNTIASMVVSTGASLRPSGTGIVEATHLEDGAGAAQTCGAGTEGKFQVGTDNSNSQLSFCDSSTTPVAVEGYLDADGVDDDVPEAGDFTNLTGGDGITNTAGTLAVDLNATLDGVGATSNLSGMEFTATNELALLQGCADGEILKWVDAAATWDCAADAGSAGGDNVSVNSGATVDPDFVSTGDIAFVNTSNTITANINAGVITNADISASAAIALSKTAITAGTGIDISTNTVSVQDIYVRNNADDTMAGDLTIDDADVGTALTVRADSAATGATVGLLITTDDDDSSNYDPFEIRDDSDVLNDLLFAIDHTGAITTGIWNGTAIAAGYYAAASIDGDDVNSNIAGRSLTLTAGSPDTLDADAELYTRTNCMTIETPTDADNLLWFRAESAITVTGIDCLVNAATSAVITVQECDGNGGTCGTTEAAMTCATTNTTEASTIDDEAIDVGDWVRIDVGTVTGTVGTVAVCMTFTVND